jgi:hypothetical protein
MFETYIYGGFCAVFPGFGTPQQHTMIIDTPRGGIVRGRTLAAFMQAHRVSGAAVMSEISSPVKKTLQKVFIA